MSEQDGSESEGEGRVESGAAQKTENRDSVRSCQRSAFDLEHVASADCTNTGGNTRTLVIEPFLSFRSWGTSSPSCYSKMQRL